MGTPKLKNDLNGFYKDTCIKVYNPEKQELIAVYSSFAKAGHRLGLTPTRIHDKCNTKKRVFSPTLQIEVAVRLSAIKDGDLELIDKTTKYYSL